MKRKTANSHLLLMVPRKIKCRMTYLHAFLALLSKSISCPQERSSITYTVDKIGGNTCEMICDFN